jgi:hypothetical protein
MKATNIQWNIQNDSAHMNLPSEVDIPKNLIEHICLKDEIYPDYNFLMGYTTGKPKEWWYNIEGITFIFMGAWSDAYIGYKDYALNSHLIEDAMWDTYNTECPPPEDYRSKKYFEYQNEKFAEYMRENKHCVFELLDYIIERTKDTISEYLRSKYNSPVIDFNITA